MGRKGKGKGKGKGSCYYYLFLLLYYSITLSFIIIIFSLLLANLASTYDMQKKHTSYLLDLTPYSTNGSNS